jgi:MFS family permease
MREILPVGGPVLLFILSLCGFAGALATRLLDPLITSIASDFAASVGVVALLASAFALPFGFSQPFLGPMLRQSHRHKGGHSRASHKPQFLTFVALGRAKARRSSSERAILIIARPQQLRLD